jgi:hypothetical protein
VKKGRLKTNIYRRRRIEMKKLIVLALVAAFVVFAGTAYADEEWCGTLQVDSIVINESDPNTDVPVAPCDLLIQWTFASGQGPYLLPALAYGTLLNTALLEAHLEGGAPGVVVDACLLAILNPLPPFTFDLTISQIEFGSRTLPLP